MIGLYDLLNKISLFHFGFPAWTRLIMPNIIHYIIGHPSIGEILLNVKLSNKGKGKRFDKLFIILHDHKIQD